MLEIEAILCHGSKNYFLLIDELKEELLDESNRAKFCANICNFLETKSDGVLFVQKSNSALARMRMFNTDGSEAQMCGNGIRCVGRYVNEILKQDNFSIQTKRGSIEIRKEKPIFNDIPTFATFINPVNLNPQSLPFITDKDGFIDMVDDRLEVSNFSAISVQNPHIVFIKKEIDRKELISYGDIINSRDDIFPEQTNINFVKVLDKNKIFVITNERGSGITASCGTGMSASSYIACELGYCEFGATIEVFNNGGLVKTIANKEDKNICLIGNATFEKKVIYRLDNEMNICSFEVLEEFKDEVEEYKEFLKTIAK